MKTNVTSAAVFYGTIPGRLEIRDGMDTAELCRVARELTHRAVIVDGVHVKDGRVMFISFVPAIDIKSDVIP